MTGREYMIGGLRTFVVKARSPRAVLSIRTPYNSEAHLAEAAGWAERGFTTVVQDVRGRYGSTGSFRPYHGEGADGLACIEWMTAQAWWSQAPFLFLYGTSYGAHCATETAFVAAEFEGIAGVSVVVPALGKGETARNRDRAFYLQSRLGWWSEQGDAAHSRESSASADLLETLPVSDIGGSSSPPIPSWHSVLEAGRSDAERRNHAAAQQCSLLAQGGTADWFTQDTVDIWSSWGGPSALALGPWDHSMRGSGRAERMSAWLGGVLDGRPWTGAQLYGHPGGPLRLEAWPSARATIELPGGTFVADPLQPFPSCTPGTDVRGLAERSDCLARPVPWRAGAVVGTPVVRVDSGDCDRHWGAMLVAHRRGGGVEQLTHGMSLDSVVHLAPLSTHIHEGEELTLMISAHAFPRYARDLHTDEDHLYGTRTVPMRRIVRGIELEMPV
ncbi:MAG: CocE/NonD family hydrolase [Rhodococcus sp. (in: high G+C Gram-positive bacteria)]